jgi:sugar/nucleoside kinase (ribokinase family)
MRIDVLAVGELMLDVIVPPIEPGRAVHEGVSVRAGGIPVNAALAAARTGAATAVAGRVGDDPAAAAIERALQRAGVSPLLAVDADLPTGTFVQSGESIVADRGANAAFAPADLPAVLEAGCVLVSGYTLLHEDTSDAGRAAIERARATAIAVVAPAAPLIARAGRRTFHELAKGATAIIANSEEAHLLTGLEPREAAVELATRYSLACVTAGTAGAFAASEGGVLHEPASDPADGQMTGAGDAFAGVLLSLLARGTQLSAALSTACAEAIASR